MVACSGIPGNECKPIPTPIYEFNKYHECAIYGYDFSTTLLKDMNPDFVDQYEAFTAFDCRENSTI